ncbi:SIMPL domain-containing protein [Rheinheimera sp. 1928-s]|uniref:SIMPL domain-containing protein n=1 Tax=Rheinheimera sp. 1928-s TaxID=3033803 RepID=UPI00260CBCD0|nr:SIMPL domain-containing protein [Rheinheimera sp. 1928-s]MDF3126616.1 SIMPL domain-containing protein [Rheinheimera sp. 1928-s]
MKTKLVALMVCCLSCVALADTKAVKTVTVSGSAIMQAKPDAVRLTMQIQQTSEKVSDAKQKVDEQVAALTTALRKLGVKDEQLNNAPLRIQQDYQHDPERKLPQRYQVSRDIVVSLNDLSLYSTVLQQAADLGVTQMNQAEFLVSESDQLYQKALQQAFAHAKTKASLLAQANGLKLGSAQKINEQGYAPAPVMKMARAMTDSAEVSFGQTDIRAEVSVEFEMNSH